MNLFFVILSVVLFVFVVWQAKSIVPRLVMFFLPVRRRLYFEDSSVYPIDAAKQAALSPTIEKLQALGFSHLGMMVEKFPLWAGSSREMAMVSRGHKTIASLGFRRGQPSYYLYTPFERGEVVITSFNSFRDFKKDDFLVTVVPSGEPAEMLEVHEKNVAQFTSLGYVPFSDFSQEAVMRATDQYYDAPYPKQQLRLAGMLNLLFLVICLFLLAILVRGAIA